MQMSQAFIEATILELAENKTKNFFAVEKIIELKPGVNTPDFAIPTDMVVIDTMVKVLRQAEDGYVSYGPYGATDGYADSLPINDLGIFRPGPAIAELKGIDTLIGKNRGNLLSVGGKTMYVEVPDVSHGGKRIIVNAIGQCDGAKIKIVLIGYKIGAF